MKLDHCEVVRLCKARPPGLLVHASFKEGKKVIGTEIEAFVEYIRAVR